MIIELIIALGLKVIFIEKTLEYCGFEKVNGCVTSENNIYLNLQGSHINKTLYHEVGHILLNDDKIALSLIEKPLDKYKENYVWYAINGLSVDNEILADYFAEYIIDKKQFSVEHPSLFIYFRNKINKILK